MVIWNILWPTFAMVALILVVWATMVVQRMRHIARTPPSREDFTSAGAAERYFAPVVMPSDNLRNLFEMPVLFFALVPLLVVTRQAWMAQVLLAWIFVILRAVHSYIHIGPRNVAWRFRVYLLSVAVLSAMWIGFAADTVAAAIAYQDAMAGLVAQP